LRRRKCRRKEIVRGGIPEALVLHAEEGRQLMWLAAAFPMRVVVNMLDGNAADGEIIGDQ